MESTDTHSTQEVAADELLAIGETARLLGVSVGTVRRWEDDGRLPSTRTLGGQRRFRRSDVDRIRAAS